MNRRSFLQRSLAAPVLSGVVAAGTQADEEVNIPESSGQARPNVLFILADQHNAKVMGHQGHPDVKTPNLDRLASEGARFNACITANPICTPSRVSFLSGQYCHNHGYYGLSGPNPGGLPTLPGHFRRAGYRTCAIGKIHCPENWMEKECDVFHDPTGTSIGGRSPEYRTYLQERDIEKLEDHGAMREFGKRGNQSVDGRPSKVSYRDGQEGWIVTKGIEFMKECAEKRTPFFAHLSLPKPHECYTPAQEFWDLYDEKDLHLPPSCDTSLEGKAPHLRATAGHWRSGNWTLFEPKTFEAGRLRKLHGYLGCVSHVDHAVGELLDFLDASGLAENTIVVYSSDHGDYACEFDIMEKAPGICSDAITRVPFIWRVPGVTRAGQVCEPVVGTVDMANTLCALTGLEAMQTADGIDLSPLLRGEAAGTENPGVTEFGWSRSIRKGPWRLVLYPRAMFAEEYPEGFGELYNVEEDPWEMKNRYFDPDCADRVASMRNEFLEWLITTTRPTTIHGSQLSAPEEGPQAQMHYQHVVNPDNKMHFSRIAVAAKHPGFRNYQ